MNEFRYERATDTAAAIASFATGNQARYLGGGTNLVDLMRETVERPGTLVDVVGLSRRIDVRADGGVVIGAGVKNTDLASDPVIRERYPVLARAIVSGASGQIRNMATVGGNIMQRTRCHYFYDGAARCNKREIGAGCDATGGFNRIHAILGASMNCVATHPSDMCVALAALDAKVNLDGPGGARVINFIDLHRLPADTPQIETNLMDGDLITSVELPATSFAQRSTYRKARDRASYAFAIVSVAAAIDLNGDGDIRDVRIALGGVAHKPWRAFTAEKLLKNSIAGVERFARAADAELEAAVGLRDNAFKIELAKRLIVQVLTELCEREDRP